MPWGRRMLMTMGSSLPTSKMHRACGGHGPAVNGTAIWQMGNIAYQCSGSARDFGDSLPMLRRVAGAILIVRRGNARCGLAIQTHAKSPIKNGSWEEEQTRPFE